MSLKDNSQGRKNKSGGAKTNPRNKRGEDKDPILGSARSETSNPGQDLEALRKTLNNISPIELTLGKNVTVENDDSQPASIDLELIESLVFKNGDNELTIRFSKKENRMFRLQVFLNEKTEIRPVTYVGASTGYTFWNLLKGSLK